MKICPKFINLNNQNNYMLKLCIHKKENFKIHKSNVLLTRYTNDTLYIQFLGCIFLKPNICRQLKTFAHYTYFKFPNLGTSKFKNNNLRFYNINLCDLNLSKNWEACVNINGLAPHLYLYLHTERNYPNGTMLFAELNMICKFNRHKITNTYLIVLLKRPHKTDNIVKMRNELKAEIARNSNGLEPKDSFIIPISIKSEILTFSKNGKILYGGINITG